MKIYVLLFLIILIIYLNSNKIKELFNSKNLDEAIVLDYGYRIIKIIKKNNKKYIIKKDDNFTNGEIKLIENKLDVLNLDNVPKIKYYDNKTMIYDYIDGIELKHHFVNDKNYNLLKNEFIKIIESVKILNKNKIINLEVNPRNIILSKNKLFLIDIDTPNYENKKNTKKINYQKKIIIYTFLKIRLNKLIEKNYFIGDLIDKGKINDLLNNKIIFFLNNVENNEISFDDIINWIKDIEFN